MYKNDSRGKTVVILQSSYIPWIGYFNLIHLADVFVLLDDVQYTRRDWRSRNQIKTAQGLHWLTIPVAVKGKFDIRICDVEVSDPGWAALHWKTIRHAYSRAACFEENAPWIERLYHSQQHTHLSLINHFFIENICQFLGIKTEIRWSMDFKAPAEKSQRLLSICRELGANCYLSGPSAKDYLDVDSFTREGIRVEWMDYSGYKTYDQLYPPFSQNVSVLDLIFNTGKNAKSFLKEK